MLSFGYLVVEKYPYLYEKYKQRYQLTHDLYALPRMDRNPEDYPIQYRGIDRDCLEPNDMAPRNLAEMRMAEIAMQVKKEKRDYYYSEYYPDQDFIPVEMLDEMYEWLEDDRPKFETIFVRIAGIPCDIPEGYRSIGFEPSYFNSDHFSASCDCMLISRWHRTDNEGSLFLRYFNQLNKYGMFDSPEAAREFLDYYLSFDWTERGEYFITEVFIQQP